MNLDMRHHHQQAVSHAQCVYVIDDDAQVREAVSSLLESVGIECQTLSTAAEFMSGFSASHSGCVVLDVRMPDLGGLELQQWLAEQRSPLPVIFLTAHADVPLAVRVLKQGAIDLIQKPFNEQELLEAVQRGLALDRQRRRREQGSERLITRLNTLSGRERQVMALLVRGFHTKRIASELGISEKTVAAHRASVLMKTRVENVVELVHLAVIVGVLEPTAESLVR